MTKLTPSVNFRRVQVVAQYHDDNWYSDNPGTGGGTGRQPQTGISLPRPLLGTSFASDGLTRFDVQEQTRIQTDGSASTTLRVQFAEPSKPALNGPNLPLLSLSPAISTTGGTLSSGNYYYAIAANDQSGNEGMLSFVVTAAVPNTTSTNAVTLAKLSFRPRLLHLMFIGGRIHNYCIGLRLTRSCQTPFWTRGLPLSRRGRPTRISITPIFTTARSARGRSWLAFVPRQRLAVPT